MKKILVIGFQPYDQKMYPHFYDALRIIETEMKLTYFGGDNRGAAFFDLSDPVRIISSAINNGAGILGAVKGVIDYLRGLIRGVRAQNCINAGIRDIMNSDYDCVIAVDHNALNFASKFAGSKPKIVLWSHDYIPPDRECSRSFFVREILRGNRKNIRKCDCVIVQDWNRAAVLDSILGSHAIPKFIFPVSLADDEFAKTTAQQKCGQLKTPSPLKLMQITACHTRGSELLLKSFQESRTIGTLYFQGAICPKMRDSISSCARKPVEMPVSPDYISMRANVAKADAGFVSYLNKDLNCHFISHASGQMVEFLRLGMPVIIYESRELGMFVEENRLGVYIDDMAGLEKGAERILKNYPEYSVSARECYLNRFNTSLYAAGLLEILQDRQAP